MGSNKNKNTDVNNFLEIKLLSFYIVLHDDDSCRESLLNDAAKDLAIGNSKEIFNAYRLGFFSWFHSWN